MEQWEDQGIVLALRPHGENAAIVSVLTETYGRACGYVHGARGAKLRGALQQGNLVNVQWSARTSENLGAFKVEEIRSSGALLAHDSLKLAALLSACSLCDAALPEREAHPGLFEGLKALLNLMNESDIWPAAYIYWEIALLRELGFSLDFTRCAGGGPSDDLVYVSPKSGCAVSAEKGAPYKDKLLFLPGFLRPPRPDPLPVGERQEARRASGEGGENEDIRLGLEMTLYFLEHWAFAHHTKGTPEARLRLQEKYMKKNQ